MTQDKESEWYKGNEAIYKQGLRSRALFKHWEYSSAPCQECLSVGKSKVKLKENFCTENSSVLFPPLHDGCMCMISLEHDYS